jgi:hypothetical protein
MKILKSLGSILAQENMTIEDATTCISEDTKYDTIRVEEPDLFKFQPLPILQFCLPTYSGKTLIRRNNNLGLDKYCREDFRVKDCFTTRDKDRTDHMLETLKKRNCKINPEVVKAEIK